MASVIKRGRSYIVVNSVNKVPVGYPNSFSTRDKAIRRAKQVKCRVMKKC